MHSKSTSERESVGPVLRPGESNFGRVAVVASQKDWDARAATSGMAALRAQRNGGCANEECLVLVSETAQLVSNLRCCVPNPYRIGFGADQHKETENAGTEGI